MSTNLPDDVTEAILLRLPALDLLRYRGVCKLLRSLISSADFVAAHLQRAKSDPHFLLVRNPLVDLLTEPVAADPFSSFGCFSSQGLLFVGSVNGLICVSGKGYNPTPYLTPTPVDIWILNPVTGLSRKLPYSRVLYEGYPNLKFAFWCDDENDSGGVYKVAKILSSHSGPAVLELWVSTSPDAWTVISTLEFNFHFYLNHCQACDVLVEGVAAYWICDNQIDDYATVVVSLDLKTLALNMFVPQWYTIRNNYRWTARDGRPNPLLFGGNLNGEFFLVALRMSDDGRYYRHMDSGEDDDDTRAQGQGWIKKFIICLDSFSLHQCLGIVNDKLVLTNNTVLALCDLSTGMLEGVENYFSTTIRVGSVCGFVGSLVSIDRFGFEWNDLLSINMDIRWPYALDGFGFQWNDLLTLCMNMDIKWPYSLIRRKEELRKNSKKQRRH